MEDHEESSDHGGKLLLGPWRGSSDAEQGPVEELRLRREAVAGCPGVGWGSSDLEQGPLEELRSRKEAVAGSPKVGWGSSDPEQGQGLVIF